VLDHDDQIVEAGEPCCRQLEMIGMGHQLEHQVPLGQRTEHSGVGERSSECTHGSDPTEAWGSHLPVDQLDGLGRRVRRREAADDGVRSAAGMSVGVQFEGFLDRVRPVAAATLMNFSTFHWAVSAR